MPLYSFEPKNLTQELIKPHLDLVKDILARRLRYPQIKKMANKPFNGQGLFRAKINGKIRLIYTYAVDAISGEKRLFLLKILDDHNYEKLKRELEGIEGKVNTEAAAAVYDTADLEDKNVDDSPLEGVASVSFNGKLLALGPRQLAALKNDMPLLLTGVPGGGKTVMLYERMLKCINSLLIENEEHLTQPVLFISQAQTLLDSLKKDYTNTVEERPPVAFSIWNQLLISQNAPLKAVTDNDFAAWLKTTKLAQDPSYEVHYELSLITALGQDAYQKLHGRQSYYSDNPEKKKVIIALLADWKRHLHEKKLFDPMITHIDRSKLPSYSSIFCDEAQNLSPVALLDLVLLAKKHQRFMACIDIEQCLLSSPFILNCLKEFLHEHFGSFNENELCTTWRTPPEIIAVAEHLMNMKHKLAPGLRRLYNKIESELPPGGIISWLEKPFFEKIKAKGASANCAVLSQHIQNKDRVVLEKELGTANVYTAAEAIGLDFKTVILWKPFSDNPDFVSLYKKWVKKQPFELSLQEMTAINALFVSLTRSQSEAFIHEIDTRWIEFGHFLLGELKTNQITHEVKTVSAEEATIGWNELISRHLTDNKLDLARQLMAFHLKMSPVAIEEHIASFQLKQKTIKQLAETSAQQQLTTAGAAAAATPPPVAKKNNIVVAPAKKPAAQPPAKKEANNTKQPVATAPKAPAKKQSVTTPQSSGVVAYAESLCRNPTVGNFKILFQHKTPSKALFETLKDGECLFQKLVNKMEVAKNFLPFVIQNWSNISLGFYDLVKRESNRDKKELLINVLFALSNSDPKLTSSLDSEILFETVLVEKGKKKREAFFSQLVLFSSGRQFILDAIQKNSALADFNLISSYLLDAKDTDEQSFLPYLISSIEGINFLSALLEKNKEFALGFTKEILCQNYATKTGTSSPLLTLSKTNEGCILLFSIWFHNRDLFKTIPVAILEQLHEPAGQSVISNFSQCDIGHKLIELFLDVLPDLGKGITKEHMFTKPSKQQGVNFNTSFFFRLVANEVSFPVIRDNWKELFKRNPELIDGITLDILSKEGKNYNTENTRGSPLYHISCKTNGRFFLDRLACEHPEIFRDMTERDFYDVLFNSSKCRYGISFLKTVLQANLLLCKKISSRILCYRYNEWNFENVSVLHQLAMSDEGIDVLLLLGKGNTALLEEITCDDLMAARPDNAQFPSTSALYGLSRSPKGLQFLGILLDAFPHLSRHREFANALCKMPPPVALGQLMHSPLSEFSATREGCTMLNRLLQNNFMLAQNFSVKTLLYPLKLTYTETINSLDQLAMHFEGQEFLHTLFQLNPDLIKNINGETLSSARSIDGHQTGLISPLYSFSSSEMGRKVLRQFMVHAEIAQKITFEALCSLLPQSAGDKVNTSPLLFLLSSADGREILTLLCDQNEILAQQVIANTSLLGIEANSERFIALKEIIALHTTRKEERAKNGIAIASASSPASETYNVAAILASANENLPEPKSDDSLCPAQVSLSVEELSRFESEPEEEGEFDEELRDNGIRTRDALRNSSSSVEESESAAVHWIKPVSETPATATAIESDPLTTGLNVSHALSIKESEVTNNMPLADLERQSLTSAEKQLCPGLSSSHDEQIIPDRSFSRSPHGFFAEDQGNTENIPPEILVGNGYK